MLSCGKLTEWEKNQATLSHHPYWRPLDPLACSTREQTGLEAIWEQAYDRTSNCS